MPNHVDSGGHSGQVRGLRYNVRSQFALAITREHHLREHGAATLATPHQHRTDDETPARAAQDSL